MEEEEPPDARKQAGPTAPLSHRSWRSKEDTTFPPALRSISSGHYQSQASQNTLPRLTPASPAPPHGTALQSSTLHGPTLQSSTLRTDATSNGPSPNLQCPALTIRSNLNTMLVLSACGVLQLPERGPAAPCCTPLLSLLPSLATAAAEVAAAAAAVCAQPQAAQHQQQQEHAPTHADSKYTTAAAAIGAATAAAAVVQQLTPRPSVTPVGGESEAADRRPARPEINNHRTQPAELAYSNGAAPVQEGSGAAEREVSRELCDTNNEAHVGALEPLLCTYCGEPRPCAAPCPLGVALAAIQGLHLRGNYCTGRFRVCCYISQPQPQQQQQQQQEMLLSTSHSSTLASSPSCGSEHAQAEPHALRTSPCMPAAMHTSETAPFGLNPDFLVTTSLTPASGHVFGRSQGWSAAGDAGKHATVACGSGGWDLKSSSSSYRGGGASQSWPNATPVAASANCHLEGRQHSVLTEDPEAAAAAAAGLPLPLPLPLSPASSLISSSPDTMAAIVAAAAAAAVRSSEDGTAAAGGMGGPHSQQQHHCHPSLEQPQPRLQQQQQQQQQQQGTVAQGACDEVARSVSWQGPCQGQGEGEAEQQGVHQTRSPPSDQDTPGAGAQKSDARAGSAHKKKNGFHRAVSFADNMGEAKRGCRSRSSKTSSNGTVERPLERAFRSFGDTPSTAAAAASAADQEAICRSRSFSAELSPEPPGGFPKKMHMQRKGRFLVVSYEDVVSAAKAAALAAIVASADEDHGAAAAAAAAAASLTEADTQQLSQLTEHAACSSTEAASLTEADTQQLSSPQGSPQQQQECLPACELQHHDLQGGAQATALGAMNGATPEPPLVFEFLQQPTSLQQRHVHARADPGTFFAAAPAAPAPADSPAAAAARIAGPPGGEEGGERSAATAAAAAAATAMLEHAANVVAGHVLGECDEVISLALARPGGPSPSLKATRLHELSPPRGTLLAAQLGLTPPPHPCRLRHSASSPCLTANHGLNRQLAAQLSDRDAHVPRCFTHTSGAAGAPTATNLPPFPHPSVFSSGAATAPTATTLPPFPRPSVSSKGAAGATSGACSGGHTTTTTTIASSSSPGAVSLSLHQPLYASKTFQPAAADAVLQETTSATTTAAAAAAAEAEAGNEAPAAASGWTSSAAAAAAEVLQGADRHGSCSVLSAPLGFHTGNSNSSGTSPPVTPFAPTGGTTSSSGSRTSPLPTAVWVPPSPLLMPPTSPSLLPRSSSMPRVPSPYGPLSPPPLPSHSSSPTPPSSPPPQPPVPPPPKEYKRGRFKVIEVKAAGIASPSSSCASPLGRPTPSTPSHPSRAPSPGLGAPTSNSASATPTRSSSPRPASPPPPTAFPHPFPQAVAPAEPPTWYPLHSAPMPPRSEESGESTAASSTVLPILSMVLPLGAGEVHGDDDGDSIAAPFHNARCNLATTTTTITTNNAAVVPMLPQTVATPDCIPCPPPPAVTTAAPASAAAPPASPPPHLPQGKPPPPLLAALLHDDAGAVCGEDAEAAGGGGVGDDTAAAGGEGGGSPTAAVHPKGTSFTFSSPSLTSTRPRAARQPSDLSSPPHPHPHRLHHYTQHSPDVLDAGSLRLPPTAPSRVVQSPPQHPLSISITPCSPQVVDADDGAQDSPLSPVLLFPSSPPHPASKAPPPPLTSITTSAPSGTDNADAAAPLPLVLSRQHQHQLSHPLYPPQPPLPSHHDLSQAGGATEAAALEAAASTAAAATEAAATDATTGPGAAAQHSCSRLAQHEDQQQLASTSTYPCSSRAHLPSCTGLGVSTDLHAGLASGEEQLQQQQYYEQQQACVHDILGPHPARQQQQQQQAQASGSTQAPMEACASGSVHAPIEACTSGSTQAPFEACASGSAPIPIDEACANASAHAPIELLPPEHMRGLSASSFSAWAQGDAQDDEGMLLEWPEFEGDSHHHHHHHHQGEEKSSHVYMGEKVCAEDGRGRLHHVQVGQQQQQQHTRMHPMQQQQQQQQQQHTRMHPMHQQQRQQQQQQQVEHTHHPQSHRHHYNHQHQVHPLPVQHQQHRHHHHYHHYHHQHEQQDPQQQQHHHRRQEQQHPQQQQQHHHHHHRQELRHPQQQHHLREQHQHHRHQLPLQSRHSPLSVQVVLGLPPRSPPASAQQPLSQSSMLASPATPGAAPSRAAGCCNSSPLMPCSSRHGAAAPPLHQRQQQQSQQAVVATAAAAPPMHQQHQHQQGHWTAVAAQAAASELVAAPGKEDAHFMPHQLQQQQQQQQQQGQRHAHTPLSTPPSPLSSPALTPASKAARKVGRFTIREERA